MNTNQKINRKAALEKFLSLGNPLYRAVAPGEFLTLVAHTDPLNFERGLCMLQSQVKPSLDLTPRIGIQSFG